MYRYDVDKAGRLITASFEGEITDADLFDYLSQMLAQTSYASGWRSLIEMAGVTAVSLTTAGVQRMHALPLHMEERLKGARAAIVVPEGSSAMPLARLYEKMAATKAYDIVVFTDRELAMKWLLPERNAP